jgi:hypothetical protein
MTRWLRLLIRAQYIGVGVIQGIWRANRFGEPGAARATNPTNGNISAMIIEIGAVAAVTGGVIGAMSIRRARHYKTLASCLDKLKQTSGSPDLSRHPVPSFSSRIAAVPDFLGAEQFANLQREVEALSGAERSYVPSHKRGGTIAYETLIEHAPGVTALYHSEAIAAYISRVTGVAVRPTPLHDQNSLSILIYERSGDHIGWHYDHNFYRGRHFTVLLPVVNHGNAADGHSHARLKAMIGDAEAELQTPPNTLIVFEGARIMHKVTPLAAGERRVLISMTYCVDARANFAQAIARRFKDTAFFGVRALWT